MANLDQIHTTNYFNAFIEVAEDCPVKTAEIPPKKGDAKTVADLQFEQINSLPYRFTSDQVLFDIHCKRKGLSGEEIDQEREVWFSKGQPCLRSSPLAKRYGWGIHCDEKGRVALVALGTGSYRKFLNDDRVKKFKAMRSKRA